MRSRSPGRSVESSRPGDDVLAEGPRRPAVHVVLSQGLVDLLGEEAHRAIGAPMAMETVPVPLEPLDGHRAGLHLGLGDAAWPDADGTNLRGAAHWRRKK